MNALLGLSDVLLRRKRYDEVIECTIKANEIAPAEPLALELLSDALAGKGALQDALLAAEAALRLDPSSRSCLVRLSVLNRKLGQHVRALDNAMKAHDLEKEAPDPLNAIGAALAALKHAEEARAVLTGLAAGKGLDPHVRETAMKLVAAQTTGSTPADKAITPASAQDQEEERIHTGSVHRDTAVVTGQGGEPGAAGDGNAHASSVLGLQRRDLTCPDLRLSRSSGRVPVRRGASAMPQKNRRFRSKRV